MSVEDEARMAAYIKLRALARELLVKGRPCDDKMTELAQEACIDLTLLAFGGRLGVADCAELRGFVQSVSQNAIAMFCVAVLAERGLFDMNDNG